MLFAMLLQLGEAVRGIAGCCSRYRNLREPRLSTAILFLGLGLFATNAEVFAQEENGGKLPADCPEFNRSTPLAWLSGNWVATWNGVPKKRYFGAGQYFDTGHFVFNAEEEPGKIIVTGSTWFRGGGAVPSVVPEKSDRVNAISLEISNPYFLETSFLYYSAPKSFMRLDPGSADRISGYWEIKDGAAKNGKLSGSVVWQRTAPKIKRLVFSSELDHEILVNGEGTERDGCGARQLIAEDSGIVTKSYSKADWTGKFAALRANRPWFSLDIYGEDLWGEHRVWMDEENTGIEASQPIAIKSKENSREIIGWRIRFIIWYGVEPGSYTVYFDDYAIPFELDIPNWTPEVTLSVISYDDETNEEETLKEVPVGQAFWIRADVKNPERFDASEPIRVFWKGHEFSAPAQKISDEKYRAGPFFVWEDVMPGTVVPPADCE